MIARVDVKLVAAATGPFAMLGLGGLLFLRWRNKAARQAGPVAVEQTGKPARRGRKLVPSSEPLDEF